MTCALAAASVSSTGWAVGSSPAHEAALGWMLRGGEGGQEQKLSPWSPSGVVKQLQKLRRCNKLMLQSFSIISWDDLDFRKLGWAGLILS